jgi:hypothetical protein
MAFDLTLLGFSPVSSPVLAELAAEAWALSSDQKLSRSNRFPMAVKSGFRRAARISNAAELDVTAVAAAALLSADGDFGLPKKLQYSGSLIRERYPPWFQGTSAD